jgi:release factor glutamine methyltransferase
MPTASEAIREAVRVLKGSQALGHYSGSDRYAAEDLLAFVLGREPSDGEQLRPAALRRFRLLVGRRAEGVPVAYVTGRTTFMDLSLEIGPGAFVPRQSSEWLVEQALRRLRGRAGPVLVDIATGIGPVALSVASKLPRARVLGVDLSSKPLALARRNAARLGLSNVTFLRGDLFAPLPRNVRGSVDVVTGHLPYIGGEELATLPEEIIRFEPEESLTDFSPTGLGLLTRMVGEAPGWLRRGGWLLLEVSPDRSRAVAAVLRKSGLRDIRSTTGELRVSRVLVGRT